MENSSVQTRMDARTGWTAVPGTVYALWVRPLDHIHKLDDCFADFIVDITCLKCGRGSLFQPADLAAHVGWQCPLLELAPRMRCTHCGSKGAVRIIPRAVPQPRGLPKNPH